MDAHVIERFKQLVKAGIIEEELHRQASMNCEFPVINGGVFWDNIVSCQGWVIQQRTGFIHGPYDHFRILGPGDIRHAFGTEAYISKRIMGIPINKITEIATNIKESFKGRSNSTSEASQVFDEFDRLVDEGNLLSRLNDQASTNIEWDTMGGEVWWDVLHAHRGWRIQQNKLFKNCRILGPDNTRYAWGSKDYVFRRIMGQPINLVVNYLHNPSNGDNSFAKYPTSLSPRKGSVVLIHGWGCRAIAMEPPAKSLTRFGYDAYCYDYQSSCYSIPELARSLLADLEYLITQLSPNEELFILTHSMGGLITRKALELDSPYSGISNRISQIVMLGPPNNGSLMADLAVFTGVGLVNKSINDMRLLGESVRSIGRPTNFKKPFGIIAGDFDLKVLPQDSVHIPGMTEGVDYELIHVAATHPYLRQSFAAISQAVTFFETGHFKRNY